VAEGAGDDRVLPLTRWVAIAIVPFLVVAAVLLFAFSDRTGELFAWAIAPPLSAFLLASAYVGGIWFFLGVVRARRWHHVKHGFPAVVVFAGALLIATLLHLDRFSHNLSFVVWMALYVVTPFRVACVAIVQRPHDPGVPDTTDAVIPPLWRVGLVCIGAATLVLGALLFVAPQLAVPLWPWTLTPLTAQVTGAVLSLTGLVNAGLIRDSRWSAFRILFQAQLLSLCAIALSLIVRRDDLLWERPLTLAFLVLVGGALVLYTIFTLRCEALMRRAAASIPELA
jgi:hypothetical protein